MTQPVRGQRLYRATAIVDFPRIADFLDSVLTSIATHDMTVTPENGIHRVTTPFGHATVEALPGRLNLEVETADRNALNRLKHALVGPILFIAASENLDIRWSGDETGPSLPDDLRVLRVDRVTQLTPRMRRIAFHGENLARFDRPDQLHCRVIFQPKDVRQPEWPRLDDRGHVVWPNEQTLDTRVYTIRRINAEAGEIAIDFALHDTPGPATRWALAAQPGDIVGILGPAAHGPKPASFVVLAGDETGLPGIARILETLDVDVRGHAFIEVAGRSEEQPLTAPPGVQIRWLHRPASGDGETSPLPDAVETVRWPADLETAFFWGGCEYSAFRRIHHWLRDRIGLPRERQVLHSHWHRRMSEEDIIRAGAEAYLP
ncbi:DUF2218 domain-containing protein [Pseudochelatococcus sp. B33]